MIADQPFVDSNRRAVILPLANLLQRLEMSNRPLDPAQYRQVVGRLSALLSEVPLDAQLDQALKSLPAAAELYENLQYRHAGLCRSPLDAAIEAEQQARELIDRVAKPDKSLS